MVGLIGCVGLDNANGMVDTIRSVIGNGLKYVEELFFGSIIFFSLNRELD